MKKQKARASRDKQKNDNSDDERPLVTNYERSPVSANERQTVTGYERPKIESFKDDNGKVDYRCKRQNNSCNKDSKNIVSKRNNIKKNIKKNDKTDNSSKRRHSISKKRADGLEDLHGETVESKNYKNNLYKSKNINNNELSTNFAHIVPHSALSKDNQRKYIASNLLAGNKKMNNLISDRLDPHIIRAGNGKFKFSDKTRESIQELNENGVKFLVENINGKKYILTSHTIDNSGTGFKVPIDRLILKDQKLINIVKYEVLKGTKINRKYLRAL